MVRRVCFQSVNSNIFSRSHNVLRLIIRSEVTLRSAVYQLNLINGLVDVLNAFS